MVRSNLLCVSALMVASAACSSSSTPAAPESTTPEVDAGVQDAATTPASDADTGAPVVYTVLITGKLAGPTATIETECNSLFLGLKAQAEQAGNTGHAVFLDPATSENALFVDTWDNEAGLDALLANPMVAQADAKLFSGAPDLTVVTARAGWYGWGTFDRLAPDGSPIGAVLIEGTLADPATAEAAHNATASSVQAEANAAGDVAHLVYLDAKNPDSFIAIDLWKDLSGAQAFYGSPAFQAAFSKVLSGTPTVTPYAGTTWAQW